MIEKYEKLFELLALPVAARRLLTGDIQPPSLIFKAPFECYGFPPALLPFWTDGSSPSYVGIWKHWFCDRAISYVTYYVEEGRAYEIARTIDQFPWTELLRIYDVADLDANKKIFAKEFGISDFSVLEHITSDTGDLPEGLLNLEAFKKNAPLQCFPDSVGYKGQFPHLGMIRDAATLRKICSLELDEEFRVSLISPPPWLASSDQKPIFYDLLRQKDFCGAWMSLNSTGWTYANAKIALKDLAEEVNEPAFSLLTEAWIDEPHEQAGGY